MSILFSSATERQIKALAKRLQKQLPEALKVEALSLNQAQELAAQLLGHADFHAALRYRRPAETSGRLASPSGFLSVHLGQLIQVLPAQDGDDKISSPSGQGTLELGPDGTVTFEPRCLRFEQIFAGCDFSSFKKPSTEEAEQTMANSNLKVVMKDDAPTEPAGKPRYQGSSNIMAYMKLVDPSDDQDLFCIAALSASETDTKETVASKADSNEMKPEDLDPNWIARVQAIQERRAKTGSTATPIQAFRAELEELEAKRQDLREHQGLPQDESSEIAPPERLGSGPSEDMRAERPNPLKREPEIIHLEPEADFPESYHR